MMGFVFRFESKEINIRSTVLHKNLFLTGKKCRECALNPFFSLALFSLNINSDYEMILQFKGNSRFPYEMCFHFFSRLKNFFRELFFLKSNKSKRPATKYFNFFLLHSCFFLWCFCRQVYTWRWGFEAYRLSDIDAIWIFLE